MLHFNFFCNKQCEYFPCHKGADPENFNCLFCFCPLYFAPGECGGDYTILPNGIKDCSSCLFPHKRENYGVILQQLKKMVKPFDKK